MEHKSPFYKDLAWYHYRPLNFELMNEAAAIIKEYHSFESFCKTGANNKTYLCDIRESYWAKEGDFWVYHITADRFLRGMVRAIVGTLALIGRGRCDLNELRRIIEAKDRGLAGSAAPPQGLFLTSVIYPEGTLEEMEMEQ